MNFYYLIIELRKSKQGNMIFELFYFAFIFLVNVASILRLAITINLVLLFGRIYDLRKFF